MAVVDENKYKPNSYKAKAEEERRKNEKVIKGEARVHKKTLGEKFKETFLGEGVESVSDYLIFEVVIPAVKETMSDTVSKGIDMLLFGDTKRSGRSSGRRPSGSYVSYDSYSRPRDRDASRRARFDFSDIEFDSRGDAEDILDAIEDTIEMYDIARVSDYLEFAGITPRPTDGNWGWTDISGAEVDRKRNGKYVIYMPKPKALR